jgi:uncharacterized protein (TIGR00369 family)
MFLRSNRHREHRSMSSDFAKDDNCFACGRDNANGLHMNVTPADEGVEAVIRLPFWVQSYTNIVHGGIIATILDEMAVWAAFQRGYHCVTAELLVRIKKSMDISGTYSARARVVKTKHKLVTAESTILDEHKDIVACASVKLMKVKN